MMLSEDSLLCVRCNKKFNDPRMLPCGESLCSSCLLDLKEMYDCPFCKEIHTIPKNGFPLNKSLLKAVKSSYESQNVKLKFSDFKYHLSMIDDLFALMKKVIDTPDLTITDYCSAIVGDIDLIFEIKYKEISLIREGLINKVKDYEAQCLKNLVKNKLEIEENRNKIFNLIEEMRKTGEIMLTVNEDDYLAEFFNCEIIESKVRIEREKFIMKITDDKYLKHFFENDYLRTNLTLGEIIISDYSLLKSENFKQKTFLVDDVVKANFKILKLDSDTFLLSYSTSDSYYNQSLSLDLFFNGEKVKESVFENYHGYSYKIRNNKDNIFLKVETKLFKYDMSLNLILSKSIQESITDISVSDTRLIALNSPDYFTLYDLSDLKFLFKIQIQNSDAFFNVPNAVKQVHFNERYCFFQHLDSLSIIMSNNGKFLKTIHFPENYDIIHISDYCVITGVNKEKTKISYFDLEGNVGFEKVLKGFSKNIEVFVEENDDITIFDKDTFIIYNHITNK
ncbi:unnamed protein product [Brachionus calyciflorus]|uniref:RING-type domain-containing protein n=1 Tax=Brachionus calyciflorus TaxID=104777 RepID=A0A814LVZ4_9BILA|nr:unnamed protein product [Brachionus calyciflorus]